MIRKYWQRSSNFFTHRLNIKRKKQMNKSQESFQGIICALLKPFTAIYRNGTTVPNQCVKMKPIPFSIFSDDIAIYAMTWYLLNFIYLFRLQRIPPLRIDDLIHDLRDGTKLLALLEVLSGEKLVSTCNEFKIVKVNYFQDFEHNLWSNSNRRTFFGIGTFLSKPQLISPK